MQLLPSWQRSWTIQGQCSSCQVFLLLWFWVLVLVVVTCNNRFETRSLFYSFLVEKFLSLTRSHLQECSNQLPFTSLPLSSLYPFIPDSKHISTHWTQLHTHYTLVRYPINHSILHECSHLSHSKQGTLVLLGGESGGREGKWLVNDWSDLNSEEMKEDNQRG